MRLLPYETFTIHTRESLADIVDRLRPHIEKPRIFSRWNAPRDRILYGGKLSETGFEVRRVIHYRNSFLPNIRGRFESSSTGTDIRITMGLHPFIIVFLLFWFSGWYSVSIPIFFFGGVGWQAGLFLGIPLLILAMFWAAFWYEVNRSRRELTAIILGQSLEGEYRKNREASKKIWKIAIAVGLLINISVFIAFFTSFSQQPLVSASCLREETQSLYCNWSLLQTFDGHPTASAIALSPDGQTLVSGGKDKAIKVWDLQTGALKRTLQSDSGEIESLAIAPDGDIVVSGSGDRMVRIWDMSADRAPKMLKGHANYDVSKIALSADGKAIVSGGYNEIKIWDLATGELKKTLPEPKSTEFKIGPIVLENNAPYFNLYRIGSNGKIALAELGGKFVALNLENNTQTILPQNGFDRINNAQISWDGKTVVATSYRQPQTFLRIWNLPEGKLEAIYTLSSSGYYSPDIALSRDRILVRTPEGLKVFNLQTTELEAVLDHLEPIDNLIMSNDGKLAIGLTGDTATKDVKIEVFAGIQ